eukprot:gene36205-43041_t
MAPILVSLNRISRAINDGTATLAGHVTRVFGAIRLVKAFTAEAVEVAAMERHLDRLRHEGQRAAVVEAVLSPLSGLALTVAMVAILAYGGARVQAGTLGIGTLTAFILYIFNIVAPLIQISTFLAQLQAARAAADRLAPLLAAPVRMPPARQPASAAAPALSADAAPADLVIEELRFRYHADAPAPVLSIDRLEFSARSQTVLLGESGCGKSTLFSLIERFYLPETGRILYGGTDVASLPVEQWRRRIGYVPQSATLML